MLTEIHPKLPMRSKAVTKAFYTDKLGFTDISAVDYDAYLILQKDQIQIHFFEFKDLLPTENYGQIYLRTNDIEKLYTAFMDNEVNIHAGGRLEVKPWGQMEFSILDPDNNLLTFGQAT